MFERPANRLIIAIMVEELLCTLSISKRHGAVIAESQMLQHPGDVIVSFDSTVVTVDEGILEQPTLERQCCRQVNHMADKLRRCIGRAGDLQATT